MLDKPIHSLTLMQGLLRCAPRPRPTACGDGGFAASLSRKRGPLEIHGVFRSGDPNNLNIYVYIQFGNCKFLIRSISFAVPPLLSHSILVCSQSSTAKSKFNWSYYLTWYCYIATPLCRFSIRGTDYLWPVSRRWVPFSMFGNCPRVLNDLFGEEVIIWPWYWLS